jgi:uncharacterized SAM-binding protein YcdF (DUF218 family)
MVNVRHNGRRALRAGIGLALAVFAALAVNSAGTALVTTVPLETPDAIITLGSHEWERLPVAAQYARETPAALVFLTQPRVVTVYNCHDCRHRADVLASSGVAAPRIVTLRELVSNTRDEASAARAECERRGIRRLLVVTSPYHTRRAWRIFQRAFAGSTVTLGIEPAFQYSPAKPSRWWAASYDRAYVRYEWAALLYRSMRP